MLISKFKEKRKLTRYPVNFVAIGWFVGFSLVIYFMFKTQISIDAIFHIFIVFGGIATGIHYLLVSNRNRYLIPEIAFYNFFGVASILCGLFLLINFTFRGKTTEENHRIAGIQRSVEGYIGGNKNVLLEKGAYDQYTYLINYDHWLYSQLYSAAYLRLYVAEGFFGFKVILGQELVINETNAADE